MLSERVQLAMPEGHQPDWSGLVYASVTRLTSRGTVVFPNGQGQYESGEEDTYYEVTSSSFQDGDVVTEYVKEADGNYSIGREAHGFEINVVFEREGFRSVNGYRLPKLY